MVTRMVLDANKYGFDQYSNDASQMRVASDLSAQRNVATFHLVRRPGLDGVAPPGDPRLYTVASTGIGTYMTVYGRVESEVRINESHSEHQLIVTVLKDLHDKGIWPAQYVIDWVYTERPACPDAWSKGKRQHDGCDTEIQNLEANQRYRHWDVGKKPADSPYGLREDLQITIFSTFESAVEIKKGALLAPVRVSAWVELSHELISLYEEAYAAKRAGSEEYDLVEYEQTIPRKAWDEADSALPSWDDYFSLTVGQFREELAKEAKEYLREKRQELGIG
jgi:hypothetical protein